jgi:hypothetical protein
MIRNIAMMLLMGVLIGLGVVVASGKTDGRKQQEQRVHGNETDDTETLPVRTAIPPGDRQQPRSYAIATT